MANPKSEIRNPKDARNPKAEFRGPQKNAENSKEPDSWRFVFFVIFCGKPFPSSSFGFRPSDFSLAMPSHAAKPPPPSDFRDHIATADPEGRRKWLYPKKPKG